MSRQLPNIVYIYADDLGMGMLSCYGQKIIETPNIDRLAERGMRFTRAYGTSFCAPARASLMCGIHDAHAGSWTYTPGNIYKKLSIGELSFSDLQELLYNTGIEAQAGEEFLGNVAQKAGYQTGQIGKLEWGFSTTARSISDHGWDYHYGYYDHMRCHGFYPPFLFENGEMVEIPGNTDVHCGNPELTDPSDMSCRQIYSQDLFDEKIKSFIDENKKVPFFLYHPSQLPHGPIFYPDVYPHLQHLEELTENEKQYASMVLRLDETVGKIVKQLEDLGLLETTMIIFASDNGHETYYKEEGRSLRDQTLAGDKTNEINQPFRTKTCGDIFNGNAGMAGLKFTNWDGGCRIPFIVSWPGQVEEGAVTNKLIANYDTLSTIADLTQSSVSNKDGISFLSILQGKQDAKEHEYVVFTCRYGPALVTKEGWKLRIVIPDKLLNQTRVTYEEELNILLYHVGEDPAEEHELSGLYPNLTKELRGILLKECDGNLMNGTPGSHFASPDYYVPTFNEVMEGKI
ncbi:sulfatase-like hydrolase/transferase [Guptibacillus hwajinpoensis]|uniref:sulfatase-like hydrolase/transferase n=1 Tax=Guptibacillus hwajinpoensis TaxID=208199 RepID=UPI001CD5034E|nr:sulfatase-like hydrolase/transferase [Pseudalkalibacillus hwajinpoensis]MCA0991363.1 sulfatase-like hydrolase/transferase [Pseudalkalibacillus hwajinpoensis]